jgi:hypothetical protein
MTKREDRLWVRDMLAAKNAAGSAIGLEDLPDAVCR